MNVVKELKAFHEICCDEQGLITDPFEVWKLAKLHATEEAKPTVKIKLSFRAEAPYPYLVCLFEGEAFNGILEDFRTEQDAIEWATACGYKVIE